MVSCQTTSAPATTTALLEPQGLVYVYVLNVYVCALNDSAGNKDACTMPCRQVTKVPVVAVHASVPTRAC